MKIAKDKTQLVTEEVISELKTKFKKCLEFYEKIGLHKSKKQLSEDISGLFESILENTYKNVKAPKKDSEPDIILNGIEFIEGKTTSTNSWRGGSYSKRGGYFFLINWDVIVDKPVFFIAGVKLKKEDWIARPVKPGEEQTYYATGFDKKNLASRKVDIYCGELVKYKRKTQNCVKIIQK
jgi:hypothetical protein